MKHDTDEQVNRALGLVIVVLAMFTIAQAFYFGWEDRNQRECIASNFVDLSRALEQRAKLTERESEAAKTINLVELDPAVKTDDDYVQALLKYKAEMEAIERARERNPLPPYPAGECGKDDADAATYKAAWTAAIAVATIEGAR